MSKSPWIALYPSDYLADTAHLGLTEHGIYWRLLLHYYQHGSPLPGDLDKICRIIMASTPEERRTVEYILTEYFILTPNHDGGRVWRHARADMEIKSSMDRRDLAMRRGLAGGKATRDKWQGLKQGLKPSPSIASSMASSTPSTSTSTSTSTTTSEEEKSSKSLEACVPPSPKKRATRLPADWAPTPDQIAWARSERKDINPATEASKFRDYWIAKGGKDAAKLDWDATWRNWVRNAKAGVKAANGSEPEWLKGAR